MKRKIIYSFFAACLFTTGIFSSFTHPYSVKAEEQDTAGTENEAETTDTDQEAASEGKLLSCFGNNAGSSYMVFDLPEAPDQEVPNPTFPPGGWQYKLCQDEAIVLITPLPSECVYYCRLTHH